MRFSTTANPRWIMPPKLPNLRHLRAFQAVVKLSSVTAASHVVHLSQPAVTQAIGKLEASFGAVLLDRSTNGSYPTAAGDILARRLERFFEQLRAALAEATEPAVRRRAAHGSWLEMRTTVPQMRALIAVVESGSFSRAARSIAIAEPSLHRAARDCERLVGRALFIRSPMGIEPTRLARELARRLKVAIREVEQAAEEIAALEGRVAARVAIACLPLARTLILPRAVNALLAVHPNARIEITDGPYDTLLSDLRSGTVDFLIGALRDPLPVKDVEQHKLFDDPFAVVARKRHPIGAQGQISRAALARYDWVVPRLGTPIRRVFDQLFDAMPDRPRIQIETSSLVVTRAVLAESDRLTLLSRRQIAFEEDHGMLEVVPFPLPETSRPIGLTVRVGWLPSPIHQTFLDLLREQANVS